MDLVWTKCMCAHCVGEVCVCVHGVGGCPGDGGGPDILTILNSKVPLDLLNLSFNLFKINCKNFLWNDQSANYFSYVRINKLHGCPFLKWLLLCFWKFENKQIFNLILKLLWIDLTKAPPTVSKTYKEYRFCT